MMFKIDLNIFSQEEENNEFGELLNKLYCHYQNKYQFLGFNEDVWDKLFNEAINKSALSGEESLSDNKNKVKAYIDNYLDEGIRKLVERKDVIILNNILVLIRKSETNNIQVILKFLAKLKKMEIDFDKDYFEVFLNSSKSFKDLVLSLSSKEMSVSELYELVYYLELYIALKPYNMDLDSTKKLSDYYIKMFKLPLSYMCKQNTNEFKLLKFLIANQDYIEYLKELIKELGVSVSPEEVDRVISGYSIRELEKLFLDCYNYKYVTYPKDDAFILKIYQKIIESREAIISEEKKSVPKKKKKRTFYDRFIDVPGVTEETKKEVIDYLITLLPSKDKELIESIINGIKIEGAEKYRAVAKLKRWYKNYLKTGKRLNYKTKKLYDRFPDIEGMDKKKKLKLIDLLVSKLSLEEQEILSNEYSSRCNGNKKIDAIVGKLNRWYDNYLKTGKIKLFSRGPLIKRIPEIEGISEEIKKDALNKVLESLEDAEKRLIDAYLESNEKDSKEAKRALSIIDKVKRRYIKYVNDEVLIEERKTLEERFFDVEGIDKESKIELIDIIFMLKLKSHEQKIVQDYLNGLYKGSSLEVKSAFRYMKRLKTYYIREMESRKEKYILLADYLKLIQYKYRALGWTKEEYLVYRNGVLAQLMEVNPKISLYKLIEEYVSMARNELKTDILVNTF